MQIIYKANEDISGLWDEGKIRSATYRLLTYTLLEAVEGGTLLANTVTGEMVLLDGEEMQKISALPCDYAPWMDELIKKHFLVRAESDDMKTADTLRTILRTIGGSKEINAYVIAPTTNCNARCFYCYQYGTKHENMTDETADKLVEFIDTHHGSKEVAITWFGGEPMVGIRQIDRICKGLKDRNIPFKSRMISNGYLFDESIAKRIKEDWNFTDVQITLDGTEKVYNEIKAYVNPCESPFQRVMQNIEHLIDNGIKVNVRLNLGFHNADDLMTLAQELVEKFKDRDNLYAYPAMLYDDCGSDPFHFSEGDEERLHEKWKPLAQTLSVLGVKHFKVALPHLISVQCMADGDDCVLITPSGKIGKCEHHVNDHFVGDIENGITNKAEFRYYAERTLTPRCGKCVLFPSCVRLKMCASQRECIPLRSETLTQTVRSNMKYFYEAYLREEKKIQVPKAEWTKGGKRYEEV